MKKDNKPIYETPIIISLGELARGSGAKPTDPRVCAPGGTATNRCQLGSSFGGSQNNCNNGSAASNRCTSGGIFSP